MIGYEASNHQILEAFTTNVWIFLFASSPRSGSHVGFVFALQLCSHGEEFLHDRPASFRHDLHELPIS